MMIPMIMMTMMVSLHDDVDDDDDEFKCDSNDDGMCTAMM